MIVLHGIWDLILIVVVAGMVLVPVALIVHEYRERKYGRAEATLRAGLRWLLKSKDRQAVITALAHAGGPMGCEEISEITGVDTVDIMLMMMHLDVGDFMHVDLDLENSRWSLNYAGYQLFERLQLARRPKALP